MFAGTLFIPCRPEAEADAPWWLPGDLPDAALAPAASRDEEDEDEELEDEEDDDEDDDEEDDDLDDVEDLDDDLELDLGVPDTTGPKARG